ncbi:nucleoside diphosphate-linked moiety X motif 19, mitochondrial [Paragonimus westermani]|uniref:Nucleoside diphosphate-linked moiety X motif 19, mitochondrial n=1 Tax=Paragonimus westermani TaxID=34504 RepID=A0A5J4NTC1_9TREM|nr:nucleoside diphosphate-linked moiety X motif 19, mitochondrial [Paragonimus westermani]
MKSFQSQQFHQDYEVLLLQRPDGSSFGGKFVFPGGLLASGDFSATEWQKVVGDVSKQFANPSGPRPPMYAQLRRRFSSCSFLSPLIGLRLCALRELFEETGLLLIEGHVDAASTAAVAFILDPTEMHNWQTRVLSDPAAFAQLYNFFGFRPPLLALQEWSNWLTPAPLRPRFDTMFFFVELCAVKTQCSPPVSLKWQSKEALNLFADAPWSFFPLSRHLFVPPQAYELGRLAQFPRLRKLSAFATERAILGCRRWLPVMSRLSILDKVCDVFFLPGDQRYMEFSQEDANPTFSAGQLAQDTQRNRLILSPKLGELWYDANVYDLGHVTPLSHTEYMNVAHQVKS